jgi:hypothetical protein
MYYSMLVQVPNGESLREELKAVPGGWDGERREG